MADERDGADEDPLTMANKANLKRLSMDVLVNLLLSHEISERYKKSIEGELEKRRPKGTWNR